MGRFRSHADLIVAAAVKDVFSRDLTRVPRAELLGLLAGYQSALAAINAEVTS